MRQNLHRIFVALEVKPAVGRELLRAEHWIDEQSRSLISWQQIEDLHITLVPPWYGDDNEVAQVARILKSIEYAPFTVEVSRISLGPNDKNPRLIWAEVKPSEALAKLKNKIHTVLDIKAEDREFRPHITLTWLNEEMASRLMDMKLDRVVNIKYEAEAVLLMESRMNKGSHRYDVLQSIKLEFE